MVFSAKALVKVIFTIAFLVTLGTSMSAEVAYAQKIKELFDKEMPEFPVIPDEEFEAQTFLHSETPFGDRALAYQIRLPKEWSQSEDTGLSNLNLSSKLMGEIALFYSPPKLETVRSKFQLYALRLEYEITAEQWLLQHILSNGFTLEGLEYFDKNKVGSLHIYLDDGQTYVVRSIAQINGKRMVLAQYVIPAESWQAEKSIVSQSLKTFTLLSPEKDVVIENMKPHLFLDIAQFEYPESWSIVVRPVSSVDRMEVVLNNIRDNETKVLDGQIEAAFASGFIVKDLEKEIDNVKLIYRKKGLIINDLIESLDDYEFSPVSEFGFLDVYSASDPNNSSFEYEVWVSVMSIDNYYVFVSMLTPGRDYDFFTWSRNVGTFGYVVKSMKLQDKIISLE